MHKTGLLRRDDSAERRATKGVTPFVGARALVMLLLVSFPQIVMWPLQMTTTG